MNRSVAARAAVPVFAVGVLLAGALIAFEPIIALGLVGLGLMVALTRLPRVPHLTLLIGVTAIVPFAVQNRFSIGGGVGSPGLLFSDALLLSGLIREAPGLFRRLQPRVRISVTCVVAFLTVAGLQVVRSLALGREPSEVGAEFRVLLGFGTVLFAVPIVSNRRERDRLLRVLPVVGLALGCWGIAQWVFRIEFGDAGDVGVREGIRFTTAGVGQIQGGLFAFPVAVLLALAALMSGHVRSIRAKMVLVAVVVLNAVSMLLGYERTFWVATALGCVFVVARGRGIQRARGIFWGFAVLILTLVSLSTLAPGELSAARERLLSLGQYGTDSSVRYRIAESRHVLEEIRARPITGSGYGATIFWGRPWAQVPPDSFRYIHNGYLWLAWRVGVPGALLLLIPLTAGIAWRPRPEEGPLFRSIQSGCQAALLATLVASGTFPSFNSLGITATMGLLLAICVVPPVARPLRQSALSASSSPERALARR